MLRICYLLSVFAISLLISASTYADRSVELVGDASFGTTLMLYDNFGGTWHDAEKSLDNTEDDLMCWAATTSNILAWGGWGQPGVTGTSAQDIFQYFQDHWTDTAGDSRYAFDWWLSGVNPMQGNSEYSQVDLAGGGFYPELTTYQYRVYTNYEPSSLGAIYSGLTQGMATGLWVGQFPPGEGISHMITCWGVNYTMNEDWTFSYYGVWVTDSDDDKDGDAPRDECLKYYDVVYNETDMRWYLKDYYGHDDVYIGAVTSFVTNPNPVPEPATLALLVAGGLAVIIRRKRRSA